VSIKFNPGKAEVPDSGKATLDKVADSIKAYPDTKVNISGHTDASGDPAFPLNERKRNPIFL
jgi:outer membrane protein OmpA-like peptidoglycan-associated protein